MDSDSPEKPNARTTPFAEVASLCEAFTGDLAAGTNPSIDAYLERVGADAQPALLRNLLAIDIDRRRRGGGHPTVEEYVARYPQYAALVRAVFLEQSSLSSGVSRASPQPKVAAPGKPAVNRLGHYRLLGELGRGGMGVVYEAVHLQHGNHVALKTLPSLDGAALHRFKREFRALADANHPNLIGLHKLEADGGQWFFTMDLVEGTTFLKYVRPGGVLDEARLRSALAQLVTAVMALHSRHIIHRDLKPSNVMVTHDGHVIVLDFGLVLEQNSAGFTSQTTDKIAGTPKYMAPEQAAAGTVTAASDWYAVGAMLYEALAGTAPFTGSAAQMLHDKQRRDPPPPSADVPADLAALCLGLLAREPQQRPDALTVAKAVASSGHAAPAARSGQQLIGRAQQLAALKDAARTLQRQREPLTLFISGRSGEGKSTLAEHFLTPLRGDQRFAVMSGRCYDRESVPFKALDTLIDSLSSFLRSLPPEDAALLMPDDIGALAQVFPVLQRVEVVARASDPRLSTLDDQQVRGRAFRALRSLLGRVCRRSLIVWCIDDLQWGDADSAEALFEVLRPPEAPAVLFLGTYRSDETEGSSFLKMWQEQQRKHGVQFADREVKVGPLSVEECTELVVGLVGKDDEGVRRRAAEFARETGGNPYLLIELAGCFDPETDSFEPVPLHEALARKLARLPAEAGPLLEVVAVSGQALALEEAARAAGHELIPVATLTRMRNERLVRLIGPEDRPLVDTYHDRVRSSVLDRLDEGRCQALHRTLAEVIERDSGGLTPELTAALEGWERPGEQAALARVYDLAYHYDAAGDRRKAWMYGLLAAEQARSQSALEAASNNYALAIHNAEGTPNSVRYRLAEGHGEVLMLLGRYEDASERLQGAIDLVEDCESKAQIEHLQGKIAFRQGQVNASAALSESGLARLGIWVPQSLAGLMVVLTREVLVQAWHCLLPHLRQQDSTARKPYLIAELFNHLAWPRVFQHTLKLVWCQLAGTNRAERLPPSSVLASVYGYHACMMSMLGWHGRGYRYGDLALALARELNDLHVLGISDLQPGIGLYASAHYDDGLARLRGAISSFEKAGDHWSLNLSHFHKGCCHFAQGDLAEAIAEARWTFTAAARIGDSRTMCSSWLWARATRGNIPFEDLKSCIPCRPDDVMSTVHALLAEGYWHTFHGRTVEALQVYERAAAMVRKSLCVNSHTILVMPMLAMGLRLHADAVQATDARQAEQLRRRACRVAKWATRLTWLFPAAYPLALRERALILAACGKPKQALKFADRSCVVAASQQAKYEHAQSLLVRGRLTKQLGLPEGDEQMRSAEAALEAIERPIREPASELDVTTVTATATPVRSERPRRRLGRVIVGGVVALVAAVLLGCVLGRCAGYVAGTVAGAGSAWTAAGGVVGCVAVPVVLLAGWVLVRAGQRHHEAEIKRAPRERPRPPSALVRHGLLTILGVLGLGLVMLPTALGLWLGGVVGAVLGLVLPLLLWRLTK